jgi:hypothetical protein
MRIRKSVLFPVLAAILSFIFVAGYFDRGDKPEAALSPENGVLEVENGTYSFRTTIQRFGARHVPDKGQNGQIPGSQRL